MFNDIDLEGLLNSKIDNFTNMNKEELLAFAESYDFSLSYELMLYIQSYFKNKVKAQPTYNQMRFFNGINKILIEQKKDFSIYSANSQSGNSNYIIETSKDLIQKHNVCQAKTFGAMPISVAANVACDYHKYIGTDTALELFTPANDSNVSSFYIHTENDIPLFTLYSDSNNSQKSTAVSDKNAWVMLCPLPNDELFNYENFSNEFLKLDEIERLIENVSKVPQDFGLLEIIKKETDGIFLNLANIPEIEKNENGKVLYLESLLNDCKDRYIFTAPALSVAAIDRIAHEYGLRACIFAIRNTTKAITYDIIKSPELSVGFDFFDYIFNFKEHRKYTFSDEAIEDLDNKVPVYLTDKTAPARRTYRAERILRFNKVISTATARKLYNAPFKSAAISVLDAISALIAKGVSKSEIKLSIAYNFPCGTDDSIELGKNLAAILGAYRSTIELCVSSTPSKIAYTKTPRSITCLASAKPPIKNINGYFCEEGSSIFFISFKYLDDGCPDYNAYRKMIRYYSDCLESDFVLSAFAINENIEEVIKNASQTASLIFDESFNINDFSMTHGLLFELKKEASSAFEDAILVGSPIINEKTDKNF